MDKFLLKKLLWRFNPKTERFEFCYPQEVDGKLKIVPISKRAKAKEETNFKYCFVFRDIEFSGRPCKVMILPKSEISGEMSIANAFEGGFKFFGIAGEDFLGLKIYDAKTIDEMSLSRENLEKIEEYAARETAECSKLNKLMGSANDLEWYF